MTPASASHWNGVYSAKTSDQVSWYRPHLERSLSFVEQSRLARDAGIIDVGGGASSFVDDLLLAGYSNITVLDISETALEVGRKRLGSRSEGVKWVTADITQVALPGESYAFWHDRAVFHFLTSAAQRKPYVAALRHAIKPGGHVVISTFAVDGPKQCSGLDVRGMSATDIAAELGPDFALLASETEFHSTPWGASQKFSYCHFRLQA